MWVTVEHQGQFRDLRLHHLTGAAISDLATACLLPTVDGLIIDGTHYPSTTPLHGVALRPGCRIVVPGTTEAEPAPHHVVANGNTPVAELLHVAGWDAADRLPLGATDHGMGIRSQHGLTHDHPDNEPDLYLRVTADGARVKAGTNRRVAVNGETPEATTNARDQIITTGTDAFIVTDAAPISRADVAAGSVGSRAIWNRPPRSTPPEPATAVILPERPTPARTRQALSWIMLVAPIPIGIVMAILWSPIFALFILMSPMLMLAQWLEGRSASKRDRRRFGTEFADAMQAVRDSVTDTIAIERDRRRFVQPDIAQLRSWAELANPRLWERRRSDDDFLTLSVGYADVVAPLTPAGPGSESFHEALELLAEPRPLATVPLLAALGSRHQAIGIVGPAPLRRAVARSLVLQAATLHGPADLEMAIICDDDRVNDWDFLKWLPHLRKDGGDHRLATKLDDIVALLPPLPTLEQTVRGETGDDRATLLALIDSTDLITNPASPLRSALANPERTMRGIALADHADQLPSACTIVIAIDDNGVTTARFPIEATPPIPVMPAAVSVRTARPWARSLARFHDPEAASATTGVAEAHSLTQLLGPLDGDTIAQAWSTLPADPTPAGPVGLTDLGPLHIDLATDGPHGLVAGTTGSGKSELLRSMVASMAYRIDPDHLNFVLIDFKGGGAFDVCAGLPHVVSIVTDLDEHLAERALRCLKAELRLREETLRAAGATDLGEYLAAGDHERLPRLVVIIDEFATLAAELPDFLDSLVDIAQRGRSLGVHMILATQRPSGVLDNKVRANTNLRIALRVQDDADSDDVIGTDQAAKLSRQQPGRAYARFGQSEITEFQAALVTGTQTTEGRRSLAAHNFSLAGEPANTQAAAATDPTTAPAGSDTPTTPPTDIERIVSAVAGAFERGGYTAPRQPWPDPLPADIDATELALHPDDVNTDSAVPIGIVDLPDRQEQRTAAWSPAVGSTIAYAIDNDDIIDAISAITLGLARTHTPNDLHIYGLEYGANQLAPLDDLPHCGGIIDGTDIERTLRLIALLTDDIAMRRSIGRSEAPLTMLVVDNYAGLSEQLEQAGEFDAIAAMSQIVRDGPALGVFATLGSRSERGVPLRLANVIEHKMLFRLVDANAYSAFGLRPRDVPKLAPGSWIDSLTQEQGQIARYANGDMTAAVAAITSAWATDPAAVSAARLPEPVQVLGDDYALDALERSLGDLSSDTWTLPIGIDSASLTTATLRLASTEHALVVGGAGSGKSSTLATIATVAREHDPDLTIVGVAHRRSPLRSCTALTHLVGRRTPAHVLEAIVDRSRVLVLIDDADMLPPEFAPVLAKVAAELIDDRHMVAACRADYPKSFDAWLQPLRRNQTGIALQPGPNDGDAFRTMLPLSRPERFAVGRAFVILNGVADMTQIAHISTDSTAGAPELAEVTAADIAPAALTPALSTAADGPTDDDAFAASNGGRIDLGLSAFTTVPDDVIAAQAEGWETPASIDLGLDTFATEGEPADTTET